MKRRKNLLALVLAALLAVQVPGTAICSNAEPLTETASYAGETETQAEEETTASAETKETVSGETEESSDPEETSKKEASGEETEASEVEETKTAESLEESADNFEAGIAEESADAESGIALYSDAYSNTYTNTGNAIQDLIGVAKTQIGYYIPEGQATKYGTWYALYTHANMNYYPSAPWCAMFLAWCAEQAGISKTVFYRNSSTVNMMRWYQNNSNPGTWHDRSGYTPKAGDIIFFKYGSGSAAVNHVGIVTSCSGGKVYTVEGNYSDRVATVSYSLSNSLIVGYATPEYSSGDAETLDGLYYSANIEELGWTAWDSVGRVVGTIGEAKRLQALRIGIFGDSLSGGVTYRTYMQTYGWGDWVSDGVASGIAGGEKRMEAVEIKLTGDTAEQYDIYYRLHIQSYGWLDWAKNGETAGSSGLAKRAEAIEIRLVKKGGDAPGSTERPYVEADPEPKADIAYTSYCQGYGWLRETENGATSGTVGEAKELQALKVRTINSNVSGGVTYRTYMQTYGWGDWSSDNTASGIAGGAKRMEAIEIRLTGALSEKFDIYYRVHSQTFGWLDWAKNGEAAGTSGYAKRIEAVEICLAKKGAAAPGATKTPYEEKAADIFYITHCQTYGWLDRVANGVLSGTVGEAKRLEGIQVFLAGVAGNVSYRTHVQTYGWQSWSEGGEINGTVGEAKRMEAIEIKLTGEAAEKYDVYYRVHSQTYGWLDWAKNGQTAGTIGLAKRLEGIEIVLVKKGGVVPGSTEKPYIENESL